MDLHYGSGDVYGYNSMDTVCIKAGKCADNFSFLTVGMQTGLGSLYTSGILGLSPNSDETTNDLFILKMKESGVIEKAVFSLMIELTDDKSKMTFGGIDLANMAALGSKLVYHNIDQSSKKWWTLRLQNMTMEGKSSKIDYSKLVFGEDKKIIVDSGTSFLLMPKTDLKQLIHFMESEVNMLCFNMAVPVCTCTDSQFNDIPDLVLRLNDTKYFIPRESYIIRNDFGQCIVGIMSSTQINFWILGLNFFSNYYTVFDMEEQRVGFAISRYAHPRVLEFHQNSSLYDQQLKLDLSQLTAEQLDNSVIGLTEEPNAAEIKQSNKAAFIWVAGVLLIISAVAVSVR